MKNEKTAPEGASELRKKAEERLATLPTPPELSAADNKRLIHELQVHQIELEMQNDELRQSRLVIENLQKRSSDLYDFAPVGYVTIDKAGKIIEANLTASGLLGYERSFLITKPFSVFVSREDKDVFYLHQRSLRKGSSQPCEIRLARKEGTVFWAQLESVPFEDQDGGPGEVLMAISDISSRKETEEELAREKSLLEGITESSEEPIFAIGRDYCYLRFNTAHARAMKALFGVDIEAGGNLLDYHTDPESRRIAKHNIDQAFGGSKPLIASAFTGDKSLGQRYFEVAHNPVQGTNGKPAGVAIYARDLTERIWAEEALRDSEARFRAAFDYGAVAMTLAAPDMKMLKVNAAFCSMMGLEDRELIGRSALDITYPGDRDDNRTGIQRVISGETRMFRMEKRLIRKDGSVVWADMSTAGVRDAKGTLLYFVTHINDITERKRAEEEIKRNETRLESLVKISQHPAGSNRDLLDFALDEALALTGSTIGYIYYYDETKKEFTLNSWSKDVMKECTIREQPTVYQLEKTGIWGEAVRQARPIIINDFHAPDPLKKGYPEGHSALHKFMTVPVIVDGHIVGVIGVANKETDYDDSDVRQLTLLMDYAWKVLDRRHYEEALRESEEKYRTLVEAADDAIILTDLNGRHLLRNKAYFTSLGYEVGEPVDSDGFAAIHPDEKPLLQERLKELIDHGTLTTEYRTRNKRGEWVNRFAKSTLIRDKEGKPQSILAIIRDITERKRAEEALRESEEKFHTLADNISQLAWIADSEGWIFWYNKRWYDYTGTTLNQMQSWGPMKGWGWKSVHHPDYIERAVNIWNEALKTGKPWMENFPLRGKDSEYRWFLSQAIPIRDKNDSIVRWFGTNTDITALKHAEESLQKSNALLKERNAELDAFSGSVAHDLRGPLTSIDGFGELIMKDYGATMDAAQKGYMERILRSTDHMAQLIKDLLNLSQTSKAELKRTEVDLSAIAREFAGELKLNADGRDVEFVIADACLVHADKGMMRIVIENLLRNAWKFTSKLPHARIEFACERNDERILCYVRDNGAGFDMAKAKKLFMAFQRLHTQKEFAGTGLGLAIVRRVIERHGGKVWAEGEVEKGATIYFELPTRLDIREDGGGRR